MSRSLDLLASCSRGNLHHDLANDRRIEDRQSSKFSYLLTNYVNTTTLRPTEEWKYCSMRSSPGQLLAPAALPTGQQTSEPHSEDETNVLSLSEIKRRFSGHSVSSLVTTQTKLPR